MSAFRIENFRTVLLKAPQDLEKQKSSQLVEAQGLGVRSASLLQASSSSAPVCNCNLQTAICNSGVHLQSPICNLHTAVCKCAIAICAEEQKAALVAL